MNRLFPVWLVSAAGLLTAAGPASAQIYNPAAVGRPMYGPGYRPALSPYLNLLRNNDPAVNYYLGTIPEFERRTNERVLQSEVQFLEQRQDATPAEQADIFTPLPGTGHATAFGNVGNYFNQGVPRPFSTLTQPATRPSTRRR